jgi:uncharacterized protein
MHDVSPAPGRFALLQVVAVQSIGAFLEWGQRDQLFLPNREQTEPVTLGDEIVVYIYLDKTDRPVASMRLDEFFDRDTSRLHVEQAVDLLVYGETPLAYDAIINNRYVGFLYHSEVFRKLEYGERVRGYVKKIREDGKVDLILQPLGIKGLDDLGRSILERIKHQGGFLPVTDKTEPETIYEMFGVSKKKFKMALGALYKRELVSLESDGVRLRR